MSALWDGDDTADRGLESTADGAGDPWDRGVGEAGARAAVGVAGEAWVAVGLLGRAGSVWRGAWLGWRVGGIGGFWGGFGWVFGDAELVLGR